jgi:hypothetical protein
MYSEIATLKHSSTQNPSFVIMLLHFTLTYAPVLIYIYFFIVLLFICAYNTWVISPRCPHPLPYHPIYIYFYLYSENTVYCEALSSSVFHGLKSEPEIGQSGNIYTTEIRKHYKCIALIY